MKLGYKTNRKEKNFWEVKERVVEESMKYTSRTEFKKGSQNAYNSARAHNWLDNMPWLDSGLGRHPKGYWKNRENMMREARKYSTKDEFKKGNLTAFLAAYRYGYIQEMEWLVTQKHHKRGYWDYEHIEEEAVKYETKSDFFRGNQTAYRKALEMGIINDFFILDDYVEY